MADEHWLGYEPIHDVLVGDTGVAPSDEDGLALALLDEIDAAGLAILPYELIEMMLFEMSEMTLDKRQFIIWNRVADAVGWERKGANGTR